MTSGCCHVHVVVVVERRISNVIVHHFRPHWRAEHDVAPSGRGERRLFTKITRIEGRGELLRSQKLRVHGGLPGMKLLPVGRVGRVGEKPGIIFNRRGG